MFNVYRRGQGSSARISVGVALGLIAAFAAFSLHGSLINLPVFFEGAKVPLLSIALTWGMVSAFFFFLVCMLVIGVMVGCFETGIGKIDNVGQKLVVFLIDTQAELQKVSWPTRQELVDSTIVVLVCAIVLGVYVLGVDRVVTTFMKLINVL
ncbi:MAG: preprotein translocase subunit SecE [Candidatus Anammoxibacter sp.]